MRAFLLLLLVVLAFLTVRAFRGAPETALAKDGPALEGPPPDSGARFLAPPPASTPAVASSVPENEAAAAVPPTPGPAWPSNLMPSAAGPEDEVAVAAALAHGTATDVQAAAAHLPRDRAILLEAFAWALSGERQMALSLSQKIANRDSVDGRERGLFEAALTGRASTPASAGSTPVVLAMEMGLLAREAKEALGAREYAEAARDYSALLKGEIGAPWAPDRASLARWTEGLDVAQREHRWSPRGVWPAAEVKVVEGDSLIAIRQRYLAQRPEARMCTGLIERANRLKGHIQPGQVLKIPTDPVRILVDLEARWALFFFGEEVAAAWPVGIGRPGEETPPGEYTVRNKLENPPWMKEGQEPIPFGDPRNPLGTRWMGWSRDGVRTSYGFHGTWEPESIGMAGSDGCVRFLNDDVEELFGILPEGAPIRVEG